MPLWSAIIRFRDGLTNPQRDEGGGSDRVCGRANDPQPVASFLAWESMLLCNCSAGNFDIMFKFGPPLLLHGCQ